MEKSTKTLRHRKRPATSGLKNELNRESSNWNVKASSSSFRPIGKWRSLPNDEERHSSQLQS
jgi:hypothetical protein